MKTIFTILLLTLTALVVTTLPVNAQIVLVEWNFPNNPDDAIADGGITANLSKSIYTTGGTNAIVYTNNGVTTRSAWTDGWHNGSGTKAWEIEFNATGYYDLDITSRQQSSGTGPRDFKIQYKVGASGTWFDLFSPITISNSTGWYGPSSPVSLPSACDNQSSVYVRWIMTSNTSVGGSTVASGGASRIDDIIVRAKATNDYYRSVANGNWDNVSVWEASPDNINWFPAELKPSYYAKTITVRNPHTVTISSSNTIDETIVEQGATLDYFSGAIALNDGPGIDIQINGTFIDQSVSVIWGSNATWSLGANGTYVKTGTGSAAVWRDNYQGGIVNIPATANWIIRRNSATIPILVSVNMYYPNLTIENFTAGNWVTSVASTFTGSSSSPVIKGNFDIGGSGSGTVDFLNDNTNTSPVLVMGNMTLKSGNAARVNGTGYEIRGNLIINGTVNYGTANARQWVFSGANPQTISGTGTFNIYQFVVNKSANDLTLLRAITVDNNLTLNIGRIFTSSINLLTLNTTASVSGASNSSFVHGPVSKKGNGLFTFPVGKNNDYQAIETGAGTDINDEFIAEYFYADPQAVYGNTLDPSLDHISKCEYWILNRISGTSARTVRLYYDLNSCGVTFLPDLRVARYNGSIWQDHGNGGTTGNTVAGSVITTGPLSDFGPFTLASSTTQNPLPVELIHFSAKAMDRTVKVEWVTASEKNNDYFEIHKSKDGSNFTIAGIVEGAGNSNTNLYYNFVDHDPFSGVSYYRLKQVDFDGTETITPSVAINLHNKATISFYPNPARDLLTVAGSEEETVIKISDKTGKIIINQKINSIQQLDVSALAPGIYFVEISDINNSPLFVEKLLIAR